MSHHQGATATGVVAILLWAAMAVLTTATVGVPPFELLALSFSIAGVSGVTWAAWHGAIGLSALRQPLAAWGLSVGSLFIYHALYFIALKQAPAVEANLINYLWPLLIVLFTAFMSNIQVRRGQIWGTALGLIAAVLLVTRGQAFVLRMEYMLGYLAALGAALIWASYSVLNRRFGAVSSTAMAGSCLAVGILAIFVHLMFETTVMPTSSQWGVILLMGWGPAGLAFWLWDTGTKHGDLALLGTLSYAAPVLSTLLLLLFGRAEPHWTQAVAVMLLLAGAWLSTRSSMQNE